MWQERTRRPQLRCSSSGDEWRGVFEPRRHSSWQRLPQRPAHLNEGRQRSRSVRCSNDQSHMLSRQRRNRNSDTRAHCLPRRYRSRTRSRARGLERCSSPLSHPLQGRNRYAPRRFRQPRSDRALQLAPTMLRSCQDGRCRLTQPLRRRRQCPDAAKRAGPCIPHSQRCPASASEPQPSPRRQSEGTSPERPVPRQAVL
jgi:hypothetical protein